MQSEQDGRHAKWRRTKLLEAKSHELAFQLPLCGSEPASDDAFAACDLLISCVD